LTYITIPLLILGLILLISGAEALIRGASQLAAALGISPLIIGLTVVAYGTSAPELVIGIVSNLIGQTDVAIGNIVGSNIFNILLVLGLSALIMPLTVSPQVIRLDVPIMILASILMLIASLDGVINRIEGTILVSGVILYTVFLIDQSRHETQDVKKEYTKEYSTTASATSSLTWVLNLALLGGGFGLLVIGSNLLVTNAVTIAEFMGISELVIGLTIVAAGTSLPEVATSIVASLKGERDIAIGNIIGSSIFNILAVLGVTSIVANGIPISGQTLHFDIPVMIAATVSCLPIFFTGNVVSRWEGALLFSYYIAYMVYLFLLSSKSIELPIFSSVVLGVIIPLTILVLSLSMIRAIRKQVYNME